jgi:uncharacterized protein (TIGR02284 family)
MGTSEEQLNNLLQGELSAVETYNMALEHVKTPETAKILSECRSCHADRVAELTQFVTSLGGKPATSSGAWGSFARLVEAGAVVLGEGSAVGALKEGEDQGLDTYIGACKHNEDASRDFVSSKLLPAQERTQKAITTLYEHMPSN